jgi:hypothetical protein
MLTRVPNFIVLDCTCSKCVRFYVEAAGDMMLSRVQMPKHKLCDYLAEEDEEGEKLVLIMGEDDS